MLNFTKTTLFVLALFLSFDLNAAEFTVNSTADHIDHDLTDSKCEATPKAGDCTLRAAIMEANLLSSESTIYLGSNTYPLTVFGNHENAALTGDLDISSNINIIGKDENSTIIDASTLQDRVFHIINTSTVTFENLTIHGGGSTSYSEFGGGIYNKGSITLTNTTISECKTEETAGGIYNEFGSVTLDNSTLINNEANSAGGYFDDGGNIKITSSSISNNYAIEMAGGLALYKSADVLIKDSNISENFAIVAGGGIVSLHAKNVEISRSTINDNTSMIGGGIAAILSSYYIESSTFSSNTAFHEIDTTSASESDCENGIDDDGDSFIDYEDIDCHDGNGGAISDYFMEMSTGVVIGGNDFHLVNTTIANNSASRRGAGIQLMSNSQLTTYNVTIAENTAGTKAGGIHNFYIGSLITPSTINLHNTLLAQNTAPSAEDCLGEITSGGYNLIGDISGCDYIDDSTDLFGDSTTSILDPGLLGLANNGGTTQTMALSDDSPAIDAADPSGCYNSGTLLSIDQRETDRHLDGIGDGEPTCDIGAYEHDAVNATTATPEETEECICEAEDEHECEEEVVTIQEQTVDPIPADPDSLNMKVSGGAMCQLNTNTNQSGDMSLLLIPLVLLFIYSRKKALKNLS